MKIIIRQQWPFTDNVVQRIILIFEDFGRNILNKTINIQYISRRFIWEGVVQQDWLRRQGQRTVALNVRFKATLSDCSPQNVTKMKNSEEVVN